MFLNEGSLRMQQFLDFDFIGLFSGSKESLSILNGISLVLLFAILKLSCFIKNKNTRVMDKILF